MKKVGDEMVSVYDENDYITTKEQKKKILIGFWVSFAVLMCLNIASLVIYTLQEFNTPLKTPLLAFNIVSCSVYAIIAYPVLAIRYKRVKAYYKMLYYFDSGIKVEGSNAFVGVDSSVTVKDGVEFINLVFLQWSDKKQEYFERNILFDVEKPVPDFKKGDVVHHVTQGNVLVAYELRSEEIFS